MSAFHRDATGQDLHVPHFESFADPVGVVGSEGIGAGKVWRQHADGDYDTTLGLFFRDDANAVWIPLQQTEAQVFTMVSLRV